MRSAENANASENSIEYLWLDGSRFDPDTEGFAKLGKMSPNEKCACIEFWKTYTFLWGVKSPTWIIKLQSRSCNAKAFAFCQKRKCLILHYSIKFIGCKYAVNQILSIFLVRFSQKKLFAINALKIR